MLSVFACAPSPTMTETSDIIVGIQNQFPDIPKYIKKRTFVLRHQVSNIDTKRLYSFTGQLSDHK